MNTEGHLGAGTWKHTPRTVEVFKHASTLSTFAHQRRYLMAQMESLERKNAELVAALETVNRAMHGDMDYEHAVISGDPASDSCLTPAKVVRAALAKARFPAK